MPVYSPTGREHARTIERNAANAVRDDFATERGKRFDAWSAPRQALIENQIAKEAIAGLQDHEQTREDSHPNWKSDAEQWEEQRLAEERGHLRTFN